MEPGEDRRGARLGRVGGEFSQEGLCIGETLGQARGHLLIRLQRLRPLLLRQGRARRRLGGRAGHGRPVLFDPPRQHARLEVKPEHGLQRREAEVERRVLLDVHHLQVRWETRHPVRRDRLQQGRLAGAVATDEPVLAPFAQPQRRVVDEGPTVRSEQDHAADRDVARAAARLRVQVELARPLARALRLVHRLRVEPRLLRQRARSRQAHAYAHAARVDVVVFACGLLHHCQGAGPPIRIRACSGAHLVAEGVDVCGDADRRRVHTLVVGAHLHGCGEESGRSAAAGSGRRHRRLSLRGNLLAQGAAQRRCLVLVGAQLVREEQVREGLRQSLHATVAVLDRRLDRARQVLHHVGIRARGQQRCEECRRRRRHSLL